MWIVNYSFLPARIPLTSELFFFPSDFCQGLVKFLGLELFSGRYFFSRLLFNGAMGKLLSSRGCSTACRSDSVSALSLCAGVTLLCSFNLAEIPLFAPAISALWAMLSLFQLLTGCMEALPFPRARCAVGRMLLHSQAALWSEQALNPQPEFQLSEDTREKSVHQGHFTHGHVNFWLAWASLGEEELSWATDT